LNQAKAKTPKMIIDEWDYLYLSFSGEWNDDLKVRGIIKYRETFRAKYEGQLLNDIPHGKGVTTFVNGNVH
jgi:hypothetical protein